MTTDFPGDEPDELSEGEAAEVALMLRSWASTIPPEQPLLAFLDGSEATALDVIEAMEDPDSELRQHLLHLVAVTVRSRNESIGSVMSAFRVELT